jgi:hypothetical protein
LSGNDHNDSIWQKDEDDEEGDDEKASVLFGESGTEEVGEGIDGVEIEDVDGESGWLDGGWRGGRGLGEVDI